MLPHLPQLLDVALLLEQVLQLVVEVEVVLDRPLLAGGHDDDLLDAGGDRLLDRVLDHGLVDEGQHLLRLRLGGGQESGAPAGGGEDGFADAHQTSRTGGRMGPVYPGPLGRPPDAAPVAGGQAPCAARSVKRATSLANAAGRSRLDRCIARGIAHVPTARQRRGPVLALGPNTRVERAVDHQHRDPQAGQPVQVAPTDQGAGGARHHPATRSRPR